MAPVILTIDDDKITHRFVKEALEGCFEVHCAMSGAEGLDAARQNKPAVILLDVEMPGMTGYEVCDEIRQDSALADIPVVFLSSLSSLQERMHGYEVGGTDYMVKPFEPDTLKAKMTVLVGHKEVEKSLRESAQEAQKMAMMALTSTSELGQVIQFVESIANITSMDALAAQVLKTCKNMALNCVLSIEADNQTLWYSHASGVTPLEQDVIIMLKEQQRINDFGTRTVINYPLTSIMIKNMPHEDPERYGRIKDIVPAILTTANGKIEAMNSNSALKRQGTDMITTFDRARDSLSGLFERSHAFQLEVDSTLRVMFDELQTKLPYMGLDEDQEVYIVDRIDRSIQTVRGIEDQSMQVFDSIQDTLQDLGDLVSRVKAQEKRQELVQESASPEMDGPTDEVHSVELF
ncbi:MAG: DNA-binding response OmpR family regulator [Candidatus Azotimanducaceae bacterium]|jgi:DNA-binding response OmpR family regulator